MLDILTKTFELKLNNNIKDAKSNLAENKKRYISTLWVGCDIPHSLMDTFPVKIRH